MNDREWTPAQHYAEAVVILENTRATTPLENLIKGLGHALCGALRSELDYAARQAAQSTKPQPPEYGPVFEEDDRP